MLQAMMAGWGVHLFGGGWHWALLHSELAVSLAEGGGGGGCMNHWLHLCHKWRDYYRVKVLKVPADKVVNY